MGNSSQKNTEPQDGDQIDGIAQHEDEVKTKKVHFEDLLDVLGHFGPFQIRVFSILTLMDIATGQSMMLFIFSNITPSVWKCVEFLDNSSLPNDTKKICVSENGSKCVKFEYDLSDSMKSMVTEYDLVCDYAYIPQLSVSIQMVGVAFGALISGYVSDAIGRKKTLIGFCSVMMLAQIITGFSVNPLMYIIMRCITGFFVGGSICVCFTMPMEFIGPRWRSFCGTFGLYGLGTIIQSALSYLTRDWRYVAFICGSMMTPLIPAIVLWVPESVRWLAMKGRFEEANKVIRWMAKVNNKPVPDLNILRVIAAEDLDEHMQAKRYGYLDLFKPRKMAIQTVVIMYCWFANAFVYYGVSSMYSTFKGTIFLNSVLSTLVSTPAGWTVIYMANRFGRRRSFFGYMSLPVSCLIAVLIIGILNKKDELGILVTVLVLVGKGGATCCWTIASIYSAEIYPTLMRGLGISAGMLAARASGIVAPQFAYIGEVTHWIVPYVVYTILAITTAISVYIWLPETNNKPLKDTIDDSDDDDGETDNTTQDNDLGKLTEEKNIVEKNVSNSVENVIA